MTREDNKSLLLALEESERRLNSIIETAVDGIITIDSRGKILTMNKAALGLFQYEEKEVIGQNVRMLMPEPDRSSHDGYIENYHRSGVGKIIGIGRKVKGKKKDGSTFPFRLGISEVKQESGNIFTGIVHDVSAEDKAQDDLLKLNESLEQKVNQRTKELEEINEALQQEVTKRKDKESEVRGLLEKERELGVLKSRFVSMASHEFRTPLTGIQSASALIDRYDALDHGPNRKKLTDMIRTSVRSLTNILNDFLSMDQLHSGKVNTHPSEFLMQDLLTEIMDELEGSIADGKTIETSCTCDDRKVYLDRNIMRNVFLNLLSNALKYSKTDGKVELSVEIAEDQLLLAVKDDGIGIPEAEQKHLFERFFRASNATNIKGTGLGLNIVSRYLELMNGSIRFESKENEGTTFYAEIPLRKIQDNT